VGVCVCVQTGGARLGAGSEGGRGVVWGGGIFFAVFGEFGQNAPPPQLRGGLARFLHKHCACRVRRGGVDSDLSHWRNRFFFTIAAKLPRPVRC
jgi:hypothetical protein